MCLNSADLGHAVSCMSRSPISGRGSHVFEERRFGAGGLMSLKSAGGIHCPPKEPNIATARGGGCTCMAAVCGTHATLQVLLLPPRPYKMRWGVHGINPQGRRWGGLRSPELYQRICQALGIRVGGLVAEGGYAQVLRATIAGAAVALKVQSGPADATDFSHVEREADLLCGWTGAVARSRYMLPLPPDADAEIASAAPCGNGGGGVPVGIPGARGLWHARTAEAQYATLVLPLLTGPAVHDLLEALRPQGFFMNHEIVSAVALDGEALLAIGAQMLDRLAAVHRRGYVYVDIRPGNFVFHAPQYVCVCVLLLLRVDEANSHSDVRYTLACVCLWVVVHEVFVCVFVCV